MGRVVLMSHLFSLSQIGEIEVAITNEMIAKKLEQTTAMLEKLQNTPAGIAPNAVFGGQEGWTQGNEYNPRTADQLKRIAKNYGSAYAADLYCKKQNGRYRVSGMGPALVRLAALSGDAGSIEVAKSQGLYDSNYGADSFEKEHKFTSIHKAIRHGIKDEVTGQVRKAALAESSGVTGGYVVPPQFISELQTIGAEDGFIEQRAKVIPMNSMTMTLPILDITTAQASGVSPYFGGINATWQPEAQSIAESEPAFKQDTWTAWNLQLFAIASNQLLMDNGVGMDALLTQLFGQAMTWYKEYAFLRGTGSGASMPMGVINAPATYVQGRAVPARFVLADAAAMMSHLQVRSWDDACWVMHQSVIPQLIQMASGAVANTASTTYIPGSQLVWTNQFQSGANGPMASKLPTAFLNGLPIFFTEKVPTLGTKGDVSLIDWSKYVIGNRMEVTIDVSNQYRFQNNQLCWRVTSRLDGRPWLSGSITDANGWTVSPMVTLAT